MPQFMLILRDDPSQFEQLSPAEMQAVIERYGAWGRKLGERHTGGRKLADEAAAAVMRGAGSATVVTDGPFGETKEIISGFFTIEADDLAHAVKLCGDHPHLDGGTIEIRQVDELAGCAGETAEARSGEATR